jgi:hypothetical protein
MPVPESLALVNELLNTHAALRERVIRSQEKHRRILSKLPSPPSTSIPPILPSTPPRDLSPEHESSETIDVDSPSIRADLPPAKRLRALRYRNYVPEEETIRNDYSQRYVDGGEWPQNWVLGAEPERRFEEYVASCPFPSNPPSFTSPSRHARADTPNSSVSSISRRLLWLKMHTPHASFPSLICPPCYLASSTSYSSIRPSHLRLPGKIFLNTPYRLLPPSRALFFSGLAVVLGMALNVGERCWPSGAIDDAKMSSGSGPIENQISDQGYTLLSSQGLRRIPNHPKIYRLTHLRLHCSCVRSSICLLAYVERCADLRTIGSCTAILVRNVVTPSRSTPPLTGVVPSDTDVMIWEGDPSGAF